MTSAAYTGVLSEASPQTCASICLSCCLLLTLWIAELEEEYELDIYDRNDIREEEYQKAGWRHDPFPEELEEEDEEEKEDWHYHSMEERLNEVGMSMRDFF